MSNIDTVLILVMAVFFLGMGVVGLAAPARLVEPFGIALPSVTARSEVRAVYGGFGVAVAAVLVLATMDADIRAGVAITVGAALAGMALGRVTSLRDGLSALYPNWFYFGVETVGAVVLFAAA